MMAKKQQPVARWQPFMPELKLTLFTRNPAYRWWKPWVSKFIWVEAPKPKGVWKRNGKVVTMKLTYSTTAPAKPSRTKK